MMKKLTKLSEPQSNGRKEKTPQRKQLIRNKKIRKQAKQELSLKPLMLIVSSISLIILKPKNQKKLEKVEMMKMMMKMMPN